MNIGGLEKCSLVDFPGTTAAVVFTQGCNFRCGYCHNPELVYPTLFGQELPEATVLNFLRRRTGKLGGVVITGGEPTIHQDLPEFIRAVKALGFKVKLDSNGSNPAVLKSLYDEHLLDYVAMDIKGPMKSYSQVACALIEPDKILKSIEYIMHSGVPYEFRTTVVKSQIPPADFDEIGELIRGSRLYILQKFNLPPAWKICNQSFLASKAYTDEEFEQIRRRMESYVDVCTIR
ncbi:MAG TPA: anaerobic ribonucleoside-triphosphate reductase activating protein [Candidatus Paceibacterota bacterium]